MRKAITLIACGMLYLTSYSQKIIDETKSLFQQKIDYFLQPLDKSKVPTGILYDRVAPFAVLDSFSTVTTTFTTSRNHFMQAWQELYDATYSNSSLLKPSQIKNVVNLKRRNDTIAIGAMNYRFDVLDGNSVQDNLLYRCMTLRAVPVCLTSPGRYF